MKIGLIGDGAIAHYVDEKLRAHGLRADTRLLREMRRDFHGSDQIVVSRVADLPEDLDLMVDCAGHAALAQHGPAILSRGVDLVTVSLGALADQALDRELRSAAQRGKARLYLASGAIGALDCLRAARIGGLSRVTYTGRKPPSGWKGSPAEDRLDLSNLQDAATHFEGTARLAATEYPKNANVAAAVALAGLGFDDTRVQLVADPGVTANIHEIQAEGAFGSFSFRIEGKALPDNPRSSALAAMSVVATILQQRDSIVI